MTLGGVWKMKGVCLCGRSETYLYVSLVPRPGSLGMRLGTTGMYLSLIPRPGSLEESLGMRLEHVCANVEVVTPSCMGNHQFDSVVQNLTMDVHVCRYKM